MTAGATRSREIRPTPDRPLDSAPRYHRCTGAADSARISVKIRSRFGGHDLLRFNHFGLSEAAAQTIRRAHAVQPVLLHADAEGYISPRTTSNGDGECRRWRSLRGRNRAAGVALVA